MTNKNDYIELLDTTAIAQRVFNSSIDRIRVDSNASVSFSGIVEVEITAASGDNIALANADGSKFVDVVTFGGLNGLAVDVINPISGTVAIVQPISVSGIVSGSFTPQGLNVAGLVTTMNVTSVVTTLPVTPLSGRNTISVTNLSTFILYIGFTPSITADRTLGTTAGWEIGPNEGFNLDVKDTIPIYAIAAIGETVLIKIMELA